ncbi:MAG: citramalate synthase [Beijerinckiaceae bacterium]
MVQKTARERLYLFDTTLRDGAQTTGVDFSLADKLTVAKMLDKLGVDYIEGGYPGANPLDTAFFAEERGFCAKLTAFGMTKRAGVSVSNDPGVAGLLAAHCPAICFVAKAWDFHVHKALGCTLEENLDNLRESVKAAVNANREVTVDCEHFFDGFKANPEYALDVATTAHASGARWVALCDTNGGTLPDEIEAITRLVCAHVPGDHLGIHAHDDTGHAVANSLAAVRAGARQIQGTLNGLGERCGNANLVTLIPTLKLKLPYADQFTTGVSDAALAGLTQLSRTFDELLNRQPRRQSPYVGAAAFATKAGIHASAVMKDPKTYEHVDPAKVGNKRFVLVSTQAGKSNILSELERLGIAVPKTDPRITRLLDEVKEREALGYAYEGADASFYVLAMGVLGRAREYFKVERFKVSVERRYNVKGDLVTFSEATVKVNVDGETMISAAEGDGPVNALDQALRKDLGKYQHQIAGLELVDFRVRIFQGGTDAVTRVLVESRDETGESWTTVRVSANIIDASFQALTDSILYKLMRSDG